MKRKQQPVMKRMTQALARRKGPQTMFALLALALLPAACTNDEYKTNEPQEERVAIEVAAGAPVAPQAPNSSPSPLAKGEYRAPRGEGVWRCPEGAEGSSTRATDTSWHAQDAIGLFTLDPTTSAVVDGQANFRYINQSAAGATATFAPADAQNTAYFPVDGSKVNVLAYYPYNSAWQPGTGTLPVPVNVANQSNLPAIDLMTSAAVAADKSNPAVQLTFEHRLTKLDITLVADASLPAGTDLSTATLTLTGTPATAEYDLVGQKLTGHGAAQDIVLPVVAASSSGSAPGTATSQAIVIPTSAGQGVAFVVGLDGDEFVGKLPADEAFNPGELLEVEITVKKAGLAQITITGIKDWGTGGSATGTFE